MKKWHVLLGGLLIVTWAWYGIAAGDQVARPVGETMVPTADSGLFESVCYPESSGTLTLIFRSGYGYEYYGVPRGCYEGLLYSGRKGEYFNFKIRGQFPCCRIDEEQEGESQEAEAG